MGGTNYSGPAPQTTAQSLAAYTQYLPGLLQSTAAQEPYAAQQQLGATLATQPIYNALNLQQAQNYAQPLAQVGQQVQNSNALAGAATNAQQIAGPGGAAAMAASNLNQAINPNYYNVQDATSNQAVNLANSVNLGGLSPGMQNATERQTNAMNTATGNLGVNNGTNTLSNAMNFGNAYNNQIGILGNALGAANGVANSAQNLGFSPVGVATSQPGASTQSNFGTGTFTNTGSTTQSGAQQGTLGFGQSTLGSMAGMNNAFTGASAQPSNFSIGL